MWTDTAGAIIEITESAAQLLGASRRGLIGRSLPLYVTRDRMHVMRALERAAVGLDETLDVELQPKGRRKVSVRIHLKFASQRYLGPVVEWALEPTAGFPGLDSER